uniref:Proline-serine-threonine phosphatase interacting protein 1b n=1 Tax=Myripristis murdjan TaxID=586833 RepID=A0A668A0W2_9TELE
KMTALLFKDAFWGTDFTCHAGYDAVVQRLRDGRRMCKDVEELLKMRALAEEKYGKELVTIARKAGGHTEIGTLRSSFDQLKAQIENIGNFHIQLSGVLKEEVKKLEAFRERQREHRKKVLVNENVCGFTYDLFMTYKCMQSLIFHTLAEKLYLANIDQLDEVRQDWEDTHRSTCEVFQHMEADRISILRCVLWDHCNNFSMQCVRDDELYEEVRKVLEKCDITTDNNSFIEMKTTSTRPPGKPNQAGTFTLLLKLTVSPHHGSHRFSSLLPGSSSSSRIDVNDSPPHSRSAVPSSGQCRYLPSFARYLTRQPDDLTVPRGAVVQVLEQRPDGWWTVERNGQTGLVPGNYLARA